MSLSFYVERRNMTGKTHVVGGNVFALGSYILMKKTGLLVDSVWEPLQLGIILPYATWASTLPDLDQNNKNRVETNPVNTAKYFSPYGCSVSVYLRRRFPPAF